MPLANVTASNFHNRKTRDPKTVRRLRDDYIRELDRLVTGEAAQITFGKRGGIKEKPGQSARRWPKDPGNSE